MPLPFAPRFVDLVRVHTTTEGTGDFVPGKAVPGFSGFAEKLRADERFYYCAQSVERPAEREVGRGLLRADGRVARESVSGALTSFGCGTKTLSLVTAAEWFELVGEALAGTALAVPDRRALAGQPARDGQIALLTEKGRQGLFQFSSDHHAELVQHDPQ